MIIDISKRALVIKENSGILEKNNISIWFEGYFFIGEEFYRDEKAVNYIFERYLNITDGLSSLNGVFACLVIDKANKKVTIFNDKISFQSICWSLNNNKDRLVISDNFWNVQKETEITDFDETSVLEFLSYRFVSGKYTLLKNIYLIEPASVYTIDYSKDEIDIKKKEWYKYHVTFKGHKDGAKELYDIQNAIFDKYKKVFGDKKIQLNLTGGLDSRYILGYLIKNNFDFATNTFGTKQCEEIRYVKKLQKRFGFKANKIYLGKNFIKDFYSAQSVERLTHLIGYKTYYYQGYFFDSLYKNKADYKAGDYMLTGDNGYILGLMYKDTVKDLKNCDELADYLVNSSLVMKHDGLKQISNTEKSIEEIHRLLKERIKEELDESNDIFSEYLKWGLLNRERNYCDKNYLIYSKYTFPIYPNYDDSFFNFMLDCSVEELKNEQTYRDSMYKYHFTGVLKGLYDVPVDQRGKIKKISEDNYNFVPEKTLYGKIRFLDTRFAERFNWHSNYLSIPFNLIHSYTIQKWGGVQRLLNDVFDGSSLLNGNIIKNAAKKGRRRFYAMNLSILITIAEFEKLVRNNK